MAVLLIANGAEFLGYLFLIVYIGAIAILFLFVIMLLNVNQLTNRFPFDLKKYRRLPYLVGTFVTGSVILKFLLDLFSALLNATTHVETVFPRTEIEFTDEIATLVNSSLFDIYPFATYLYTEQSALLVVASLLLLSAMLGAIVLAVNSTEQT
jgi:NADH:ubiquinone oxidoreductase subunit 6 (subunit J)